MKLAMKLAMKLDDANAIIGAALATARDMGGNPLAVAVVDGAGTLVALARQDGAPPLRAVMAQNKAWSVIASGRSTRALGDMQTARPTVFSALCNAGDGRLVPLAGGVPVVDAAGMVLGAVGISGDTSDHDETCAMAGVRAVGFSPGTV